MKYALYARSAIMQNSLAKTSPLDHQIQAMKDYCASKGWDQTEIFIDNGFGGHNGQRPAYQKMIAEIKNGEIKAVVVTDITRLSRKIADALEFSEFLNKNGVSD